MNKRERSCKALGTTTDKPVIINNRVKYNSSNDTIECGK